MILSSPARFRAVACGRRWGKTRAACNAAVEAAVRGQRVWWVAPTYPMSLLGWREIKKACQAAWTWKSEEERRILLPTGGELACRSADNPDSLRGEGLDLVVVDEASFVKEEAWTEALRPALSDRKGRAIFISTPKGHNWFWRAFTRGQDPQEREWASWQFPTSSSPFIDASEIDAARQELPERIFRQEYLAEFMPDAGGIFRKVAEAATATPQDKAVETRDRKGRITDRHEYAFGVDWGKLEDFSVFTVVDLTTREVVALDRFQQIDYTLQVGRLKALAERFDPRLIVAERNSMGEPLVELLQRDGLPVLPFTTTNATKASAIDALALAFERSEIRILNDPVLIGELQAYEAERLPSGMLRYSAPAGMHDDCVMSLALAWQGVGMGVEYGPGLWG